MEGAVVFERLAWYENHVFSPKKYTERGKWLKIVVS